MSDVRRHLRSLSETHLDNYLTPSRNTSHAFSPFINSASIIFDYIEKKLFMRKFIFFSGFLLFLSFYQTANAQGCSDAGFCSMSSFKPQSNAGVKYQDRLRIGFSAGKADNDIFITGQYLELNKSISDQFSVDTRITSLSQSGTPASTFGFSDIYINGNY